jgi:hypothetical protein
MARLLFICTVSNFTHAAEAPLWLSDNRLQVVTSLAVIVVLVVTERWRTWAGTHNARNAIQFLVGKPRD